MGFPRQTYWNGLSFLSPADLTNPGIEPMSFALQADSLPLSHQGSPYACVCVCVCVCILFHTDDSEHIKVLKSSADKKIFHSVNHLTLQVADDGGLNLDPLRALILVSDPALVSNGTCGSSTEDSCPATGPNVSTNRAERALQFYFSQGSPGSVICMWP